MDSKKKFGLIMTKKSAKNIKTKSIFESDSEEDTPKTKRPKIPQKNIDLKNKIKTELLEDPSIYEYDSIYDDMKAKQAESIAPKEKKNSRFIETLLKAADKRKKEHERRIEKKIQKERDKEGDQFKDKEAFVSSSYKKKLLEREQEEERERRENMLNDMMDVTKQKDLSGFYRHFLNQTIGEEKIPTFSDSRGAICIKEENMSGECSHSAENDRDSDNKFEIEKVIKKEDSSPEHGYNPGSPKDNDDSNLDKDSDGIEIDSDSNSENNECTPEKISPIEHSALKVKEKHSSKENNCEIGSRKSNNFHSKKNKKYRQKPNESDSESESSDNDDKSISNYTSEQNENDVEKVNSGHNSSDSSCDESKGPPTPEEKSEKCKPSESEKQARRNIYIKRTVGDIFAEAQARYFQRMNNKNIAIS